MKTPVEAGSNQATGSSAGGVIEVATVAGKRFVRVLKPQRGSYCEEREFQSDWPEDLLYSLANLKSDWFLDSYQRFEHPNYVQKQIDIVLDLYGLQLGEAPLLDFGCGFGASSYCMIKRGARRIVAVDLMKPNTDFAAQFFSSMGVSPYVEVHCEDIVPALKEQSFGIIWLQAVIEHLMPEERLTYLWRFWQALCPGGVLIITETPNRLWPIETHTTDGTWWIPWMKPGNVFQKMRKQPQYCSYSDEDFYRSGIIGSSYREILDCLARRSDCTQLSLEVRGYLRHLYARAMKHSFGRHVAISSVGVVDAAVRRILRRPITAFMPFLNHLAFKRGAVSTPS